jgi:surface polysaccharide O-acyltransferase-like enzyme
MSCRWRITKLESIEVNDYKLYLCKVTTSMSRLMQSNRQNIEWIDSLRVIATIGVIMIHEATPVVKMSYGGNMGNWWTGNIFDSAVRFAVPLFLMLSGATMLGKEYDLKTFYKKRFVRVLFPFLFWMLAYWVYRWMVLPASLQPHTFSSIWFWAVKLLGNEGISKHFWYVYMILFFYLLFPWIGKGVRGLKNREVFWLIIGWALLSFSSRKLSVNFYSWTDHYPAKLLGYCQYSGYLVLGYYLTKFSVTTTLQRMIAGGLFVISVAFTAVSTFYYSQQAHHLDLSMYGNITFNAMLQVISLFLLLKDTTIKNKILLQIQRLISKFSYGVYLSHIMVIGVLFQYDIFWTIGHPAWTLPLLTLLTLTISLLIVFLLRKLPYGRHISG